MAGEPVEYVKDPLMDEAEDPCLLLPRQNEAEPAVLAFGVLEAF